MVFVLAIYVSLVSLFSSCNTSPKSKAMVVVNENASAINYISIKQYVPGSKTIDTNALDDETIVAGGRKTFYLAPYSEYVYLHVDDDTSGFDDIYFTYDYKVHGIKESITVTYNGMMTTVSGSNAKIAVIQSVISCISGSRNREPKPL